METKGPSMSDTHREPSDFISAWASAEERGDVTFLDEHLARDFRAIGPLGFKLSRADWLDRHASGALRYETFTVSDVEARAYGETAVVTLRQSGRGTHHGQPVPAEFRATLVLCDRGGDWQLASIHI